MIQEVVEAKKHDLVKMSAASNPLPSATFPFLKLPAEIRNMIYSYLLICPTVLGTQYVAAGPQVGRYWFGEGWNWTLRNAPPVKATSIDTAVLSVSREISTEARAILFSQPIHCRDLQAMYYFARRIGPDNRSLLRDIGVHTLGKSWSAAERRRLFSWLAQVRNVRRLRIAKYAYLPYPASPEPTSLSDALLRVTAPFFQEWESGEGRCDTGVEILELGKSNFAEFLDEMPHARLPVVDPEESRQEKEEIKAYLRSLLELDKNQSVKSGVASKKMV